MLKVAIIGRPNVGKSTLFNRLAGKKFALVHDAPGVTRDWRDADATLYDLTFKIIDSAGLEDGERDSLAARMTKVALSALGEADVALFLVDARAGLTAADRDASTALRKSGKPVIVVANKCDNGLPDGYDDFHALGFDEPVAISAEHGLGMRDLYEALKPYVEGLGTPPEPDAPASDVLADDDDDYRTKPLHLAIIGRPNAGKSTLVNALIGEDRMLTGPEAGLTRDAVHIQWEYNGRAIRLVDTAGIRRTTKVHEKLEKMSVSESERAIRLAHVVVLVVDAEQMFENQDLHLAQAVEREGRALVIAINKWDNIKNKEEVTAALRNFLDKNIAQMPDISIVMISALKGQKLDKLMDSVFAVHELWNKRISTSQLNKWLSPLLDHHPPPLVQGRRLKIRYMTQIKSRPPTFVFWVNKPLQLPDAYQRYLANNMRESFNMPGVPLRFILKAGDNPYDDKD